MTVGYEEVRMGAGYEEVRETLALCAGALRAVDGSFIDKEALIRLHELGRYAEKLLDKEVTRLHQRKPKRSTP